MGNENTETQLAPLRADFDTIVKVMSIGMPKDLDVAAMVENEIFNLEILAATTKPEIKDCLPVTIVTAVRNALRKGLSLNPDDGLVYIKTRSVKVGGAYKKALEISETANGIISVARQAGRILDIKRPTVTFTKNDELNGMVIGVSVEVLKPSTPSPRWETISFSGADFKRWAIASHKENARSWRQDSGKPSPDINVLNYANQHYTSWNGGLDPEFARAKAIRHALKKLGTNLSERKQGMAQPDKHNYVAPDADLEAMQDESGIPLTEDQNGYTPYEEFKTETKSNESNFNNQEEPPIL